MLCLAHLESSESEGVRIQGTSDILPWLTIQTLVRLLLLGWQAPSSLRVPRLVCWLPPPQGSFKLNTDGSVLPSRYAAAGGVVRNHLGEWIQGFTANIGIASSFEAELWGLLYGLRLCRTLLVPSLVVELDSAAIVSLLGCDGAPTTRILCTLLVECVAILRSLLPNVSVRHTVAGREPGG